MPLILISSFLLLNLESLKKFFPFLSSMVFFLLRYVNYNHIYSLSPAHWPSGWMCMINLYCFRLEQIERIRFFVSFFCVCIENWIEEQYAMRPKPDNNGWPTGVSKCFEWNTKSAKCTNKIRFACTDMQFDPFNEIRCAKPIRECNALFFAFFNPFQFVHCSHSNIVRINGTFILFVLGSRSLVWNGFALKNTWKYQMFKFETFFIFRFILCMRTVRWCFKWRQAKQQHSITSHHIARLCNKWSKENMNKMWKEKKLTQINCLKCILLFDAHYGFGLVAPWHVFMQSRLEEMEFQFLWKI